MFCTVFLPLFLESSICIQYCAPNWIFECPINIPCKSYIFNKNWSKSLRGPIEKLVIFNFSHQSYYNDCTEELQSSETRKILIIRWNTQDTQDFYRSFCFKLRNSSSFRSSTWPPGGAQRNSIYQYSQFVK